MGSRIVELGPPARRAQRDRLLATAGARARLLSIAGTASGALVLFLLYERLSFTAPVTSDSANAVLQGQAMARGNVLLQGWTLSGASFLATDLPFYAVIAWLRGVSLSVAHDAGAAIYTLLVVSACFLARGRARGTEALVRMAIPLVLLIAPAPGAAAQLLLLGPFHVGTTLLLILALISVDRALERPLGIATVWVLLTLAVLSDMLAMYVGVLALAFVSAAGLVGRHRARRSRLALLMAAALALPAATVIAWVLHERGGFTTVPVLAAFARIEDMPRNLALTVEGTLLVFGADFFGQPVTAGVLVTLVRLAGLAFVAATWGRAVRSWCRGEEPDLVTRALVVGMAVDVAAYLFSNQAIDLRTSRYLIPLLAFGAVLAGRCGADWVWPGRLRLEALALAVGYLGVLAVSLEAPVAVNPEVAIGEFLERQNLTYGLSGYWEASTVTVATGGRVRVRAITVSDNTASAYRWEAVDDWYNPSLAGNNARFVLRDRFGLQPLDRQSTENTFGQPSREYNVGRYDVMVWDRNLLTDMNISRT